jgi:transposase
MFWAQNIYDRIMSNKAINMHKLRQLLRLHGEGHGAKYISRMTGIARNTVKKYLLRYVSTGLPLSELAAKSDSELSRIFLTEQQAAEKIGSERSEQLGDMFLELATYYKKRGITKKMTYELYKKRYPEGYKSSQFLTLFNAYTGRENPSVRVIHKAGDKLFIDFTGEKLHLVDKTTGELRDVEVFVAILGCSQLTFVMAVASQKKEDFMMACEQALHFYGGVPAVIVPDNLKSAVHKASRYEAELNESFASFAAHYQTFVFPTRAYKPKDKALVEGAVGIIYTTIFTKIDEKVYSHLDDLNRDILLHLEAHNNSLLTGCDYSRRGQFEAIEKQALQPLNPFRYDPMDSKIVTVAKTGYVILDKRYYSVPYKYIGKKIKLLYNSSKIEAYDTHELIAVHERSYGKEKYIENPEHLASWHRYPSEWNPEKFIADAALIDEAVAMYIKEVLKRNDYPEKNYRAAQGILNYAKRVGAARVVNACKRAHSYGDYSFYMIERILLSKMDMLPLDEDSAADNMPEHDNIRGGDYYA